jgi:hypothetical protein
MPTETRIEQRDRYTSSLMNILNDSQLLTALKIEDSSTHIALMNIKQRIEQVREEGQNLTKRLDLEASVKRFKMEPNKVFKKELLKELLAEVLID